MSIKINKGGELGKYFYSKDDVIYGPIKLDELLQRVDENTLVFYNGIDWTKANELPELKKFIHDTPRPPVIPVEEILYDAPKSSNKAFLYLIIIALIILGVIYLISKKNTNPVEITADSVSNAIDTTSLIASPVAAPVDAYTTILSVRKIGKEQLDNLTLSDLIIYQNDILARHGYIFESEKELTHYKSFNWYNPVNNYLAATSDFSEIEKYNYDGIQLRLNEFSSEIRNIVTSYFQSISDQTFDATNFFAEKVDYFITKKNTTPWEINDEMKSHYSEFVDSKFTFTQDFEITYHESINGVNYISFKGFFEAFRTSKNKKQECVVTIKLGLNKSNKIVYYKEEKIENLKFIDIN